MKKLFTVLVLCFCVFVVFAETITDKASEMFPSVSLPIPIAHFPGDEAPQTITLYAMRNANFFLDSYKALVEYHNVVAKDATLLVEVNQKLVADAKQLRLDVVWNGTKWAVIGFVAGAATVGIIALVSK